MADFYGCLESTSFRVKDEKAFLAEPAIQRIKTVEAAEGFFEQKNHGYFAFGWYGQYPSPVIEEFDYETEEETQFDILDVIHRHIIPGDVCRIQVSGNEKLRYIGGGMWLVSARGVVHFDAELAWDQKETVKSVQDEIHKFLADVMVKL